MTVVLLHAKSHRRQGVFGAGAQKRGSTLSGEVMVMGSSPEEVTLDQAICFQSGGNYPSVLKVSTPPCMRAWRVSRWDLYRRGEQAAWSGLGSFGPSSCSEAPCPLMAEQGLHA
jgi:hypothetical protein